ncbi:hypothetical protein N7470_004033 [Penicillium chermesinum]|nr:hypothetical protein N7470_004033 [Penicillium chermesinum]
MDIDPSPAQEPRSSRKHLRTSDEYDDAEWSSDVSGRFDDADEPEPEESKTPSAKSVKRRRSNDWPLPEEAADYGNADCRNGRNGHVNFGASQKSSPRTSATSLRSRNKVVALTNSPRHHRLGRRSRFVEASMSDSVSEKPPSILFQEGKPPGPQHRQSGAFVLAKPSRLPSIHLAGGDESRPTRSKPTRLNRRKPPSAKPRRPMQNSNGLGIKEPTKAPTCRVSP